jgi:hypothetical protein
MNEEAPEKTIVRETHRHEDGTLIGPEKQTPDPEEIKEQERPSLGAILVREMQELRKRKEEEARQKAEQEAKEKAVAGSTDQPIPLQISQIHAVAGCCLRSRKRSRTQSKPGRFQDFPAALQMSPSVDK